MGESWWNWWCLHSITTKEGTQINEYLRSIKQKQIIWRLKWRDKLAKGSDSIVTTIEWNARESETT